jgi:3-oxoacyl-[acyl-carrier-protein] synthase II
MRRRVVITGIGVVAPNGIGKDSFWKALTAGSSAVGWITRFDSSPYECRVAAEISNFRPEQFMHPRRAKHRGRFSQFAVAAAKLAAADAVLPSPPTSRRTMACIGSAYNGLGDVYEPARLGFDQKGVAGVPTMSAVEYSAHAPVSHVSAELGISGQAMTLASACATGLDVVQWASSQIQQGNVDIVLAGSTETPISTSCFFGFSAMRALSTFNNPPLRASRPYDLHRAGLVIGEGCAVFVFEELDHARARVAPIYAEVLGYGSGNEGAHATKMDASEVALTEAIDAALHSSGLQPCQIDHINAHGNALPDFDLVETLAFKRALGRHAYSTPVVSIKSMIGHALGAAASLQVAAACMTISNSTIPPTINLEYPDPECDLDYVPLRRRLSRVRNVLINAHALGGTHSALILGTPPI